MSNCQVVDPSSIRRAPSPVFSLEELASVVDLRTKWIQHWAETKKMSNVKHRPQGFEPGRPVILFLLCRIPFTFRVC